MLNDRNFQAYTIYGVNGLWYPGYINRMPENRTINNLGTQIAENLNSEIRTIFFEPKGDFRTFFRKNFFHDDR